METDKVLLVADRRNCTRSFTLTARQGRGIAGVFRRGGWKVALSPAVGKH
jgi:hypothetical protein